MKRLPSLRGRFLPRLHLLCHMTAAGKEKKEQQCCGKPFQLHPALFEKLRKGVQQITGEHSVLPQGLGAYVACCAVKPGGTGGSLYGRKSLPQKGDENAGEHIAAAAHRHTGISCEIAVVPAAIGDACPVAL